jgi:hypothetical protein
MSPDALATILDRAARELDFAAEAIAEPIEAISREARAIAQALRCCPSPGGLPALAESLAARLKAFDLTAASPRVSFRLEAAARALREGVAP